MLGTNIVTLIIVIMWMPLKVGQLSRRSSIFPAVTRDYRLEVLNVNLSSLPIRIMQSTIHVYMEFDIFSGLDDWPAYQVE